MLPIFKLLKRFKGLRGTAFDVFGYTQERRMERALIGEYEECVERLLAALTPQNHALAVEIASLAEEMRGFGHIKKRNVEAARRKREELLTRFAAVPAGERAAA
jgi:indolepyruvate ferredoxin oxidoreductase